MNYDKQKEKLEREIRVLRLRKKLVEKKAYESSRLGRTYSSAGIGGARTFLFVIILIILIGFILYSFGIIPKELVLSVLDKFHQ